MLGKPFEWDACQFPVNALDLHYRSFQKEVLPVCLKRKIGAIGMKGLGGGNGIAQQAGLTPEEAYRYALSQPIASQVVGMTTLEQLKQNITMARAFKPQSKAEQSALAERVKPFATDGRFEQFKSTQVFDGPVHRRQHGFTA
jgi:predicted aldo/keto reductase-like oxidoreductase